MSDIPCPFLPPGRSFKFVGKDDPFIQEAALARDACAGDRLFPVGAVLVRDGQVLARAGNGYNRGRETVHVCPRVVLDCPSGTGYELCQFHDSPGHAELMLMAVAKEQGIDLSGCDVYLFGHWWCCEPCWKGMIEQGIGDVYLFKNAHVEFHRDRVYAQTLQSQVHRAYIAGAYTNNGGLEQDKWVYHSLGSVCEELGCTVILPFRDNPENQKPQADRDVKKVYQWTADRLRDCDVLIADVSSPSLGVGGELTLACLMQKPIVLISKNDSLVSDFALGNPAVVYHIRSASTEDVCRQLKNVLKQLVNPLPGNGLMTD